MPKGFTKNELLISIPIAVIVLCFVIWGMWYEFARTRDAQVYSDALMWHSALNRYFHLHAVYPSTPTDAASLAGLCLIDKGFVAITDPDCSESTTVYHASTQSSSIYYPRTAQNTPCSDSQGCSRYYMTIPQNTRAISGQPIDVFRAVPRGLHVFGPDGLLIDQKQIPGI